MGMRKELENDIALLKYEREKIDQTIAVKCKALDALPTEPVRLRAEDLPSETIIAAGEDEARITTAVAVVYKKDCARHNIDPAALAAHICGFNQPAPPPHPYVAHEAEVRALVEAAKEYTSQMDSHGFAKMKHAELIRNSYRALDAAIRGKQ